MQVVDARDPLLYRSTDLEAYAREIHNTKSSFILMNKSDLLPDHVRTLWADYYDEVGAAVANQLLQATMSREPPLKPKALQLATIKRTCMIDAPNLMSCFICMTTHHSPVMLMFCFIWHDMISLSTHSLVWTMPSGQLTRQQRTFSSSKHRRKSWG
jgi:hypothetical protein